MKRRQYVWFVLFWLVVMGVLFVKGILVQGKHPFDVWAADYPDLGSYASPGMADLNGDGMPDVVVGAGRSRFVAGDSAVVALDGANGRELWWQSANAELYGTPIFLDLNGDFVPDPVLHGRRAQLMALDGRDGSPIWRYKTQDTVVNATGYTRFNFYQPQVLPDLNGDGLPELLLSNGGNEIAEPLSKDYRYPGVLLVINGSNGTVMAADTMPDGLETYMAPLLLDKAESTDPYVVFATGGENFGGSLYRAALSELLQNDLSSAERLFHTDHSGFIGSPTLADVNLDGQMDILAVAHHGPLLAIDGSNGEVLWIKELGDFRTYSTVVSGHFNGDAIPDVLLQGFRMNANRASGARQLFLNGRDGTVIHQDSIGCGTMADPVLLDANGDGVDEVLFSINSFSCQMPAYVEALHYLLMIDPASGIKTELYPPGSYKNIASTPWIGDMDANGKMDVVFVQQGLTSNFFMPGGILVQRLATDVLWPKAN